MTKPGWVPKPAVQPLVAATPPPPSNRRAYWVWVAAVALALIGLILTWWQPFATKPTPVVVEIVTPGPITRVLAVNGQVAALKSVSVHSAVSGTLLNLWVAEGDLVKPGDILVQIDATQQAAILRQAVAALDAGLVAQSSAKATLARTQALGSNVARVTLDDANSAVDSAEQEVTRLMAGVDQGRSQLAHHTITAPIAGTIMAIDVDLGQLVDPAAPIVTVADLRALVVETDVDEAYATQIKVGQQAVLKLVGAGQNLAASVSFVSPQVDADTGGLAIRLTPDAPLQSPVGLTATANIIVEQNPSAISAPRSAILTSTDGSVVFLMKDGIAKRTAVQVVDWPASRLIVTDGLAPADRLIVDAKGLVDGQLVKAGPPETVEAAATTASQSAPEEIMSKTAD
jgi:RND family efflux transporter MFP subunit